MLDLTLPVMSGPELATRVCGLRGRPIPILVLSGDGRGASKAEQLGAVGHLSKPFQIDDLLISVAKALRPSEPSPSLGDLPVQAQ